MAGVILIMAKQPIAGASKTRLTPMLNPADAAELSRCFILDAVGSMTALAQRRRDLDVVIAGAPATAEGQFKQLAPGVGFVAQVGDTLGQRLNHVLSAALESGAPMAVAINSDSPTLPPSLVGDAFDRLADEDVDVVLGPAEDGGYYLIGWKQSHPRMVEEVEMSTPRVLADTLAIAEGDGLRVALTTPWYDVDQPEDLRRLRADLDRGRFCGPRTKALFDERPGLGLEEAGLDKAGLDENDIDEGDIDEAGIGRVPSGASE